MQTTRIVKVDKKSYELLYTNHAKNRVAQITQIMKITQFPQIT